MNLMTLQARLAAWLVLWAVAPAPAAPRAREARPAEVATHLQAQGREVLTFAGYSGAGYEDPAAMLAHAARVLDAADPRQVLVNGGGTAEGIGAVYRLARERGFRTMGIVSSRARDEGVALSPFVDDVFFIADATWGGLQPNGQLSPTSQAMVALSTRFIAIGGGAIARDELLAAQRLGKPVSFIAADMDHRAALAQAAQRGEPAPTDFRGVAHAALAGDGSR
jgi:hypothetical protein